MPSSSNHCSLPPHALAATGMGSSAHQRFCPSSVCVSHHRRSGKALFVSGSFELQNSVSPIALGSPELAATGYTGITPHTPYSWMLVEGLATGVVPDSLPSNVMHYVTKGCEHKIWYVQAWFLVYRIICSETRCVLSVPMTGNVGACLPLSLGKISPL